MQLIPATIVSPARTETASRVRNENRIRGLYTPIGVSSILDLSRYSLNFSNALPLNLYAPDS
jgi:hypothetical protein